MPTSKLRILLFMLLLFPAGLLLHLIFVDASILLSVVGDTFGRVLAICGINGIIVSEKPGYMWAIYLSYMTFITILGVWLTIMLKNSIESLFFNSNKSDPEKANERLN
jgi:hypothetical protein